MKEGAKPVAGMSPFGPSCRVQRLTTSVAIGGIADIGWPAGGKGVGSVRHPLGTADFASICCDISATTANIRRFFRIKARRTTCLLHNASGKVSMGPTQGDAMRALLIAAAGALA